MTDPEQPVQVVPQPSPFQVAAGVVRADDGTHLVQVEVRTLSGSTVLFGPPDLIRQIASGLLAAANQATAAGGGLLVTGHMPTGPAGPGGLDAILASRGNGARVRS